MEEKVENKDISKWPIPALLFIGVGLGLLTGQIAPFVLICFGIGILIVFLTSRD